MYQTENNDTGSLKVGTSAGEHVWAVGDQLKIGDRQLKVTYVMGKGDRCHICCKGGGIMPIGVVKYEIIEQ